VFKPAEVEKQFQDPKLIESTKVAQWEIPKRHSVEHEQPKWSEKLLRSPEQIKKVN
jgi:hypothetical protein